MIFWDTWIDVVAGRQTQTRRGIRPNEHLFNFDKTMEIGRGKSGYVVAHIDPDTREWKTIYRVGKTYPVQPHPNHPALLYLPHLAHRGMGILPPDHPYYSQDEESWKDQGYIPAFIKITDIFKQDVRDMSADELKAEASPHLPAYLKRWKSYCYRQKHKRVKDERLLWPEQITYESWALTFKLV